MTPHLSALKPKARRFDEDVAPPVLGVVAALSV
jgi:hypothetical protein